MGCNKCKGTRIDKTNNVTDKVNKSGEQIKMKFPERMLNLFFRIFVFLFLIGVITPIIIPLVIAVIFNVIFNTHSFDITTGIKRIIRYIEDKFDFKFKDRDDFDYDEYEDDEELYEINESEVNIVKEEKDVK